MWSHRDRIQIQEPVNHARLLDPLYGSSWRRPTVWALVILPLGSSLSAIVLAVLGRINAFRFAAVTTGVALVSACCLIQIWTTRYLTHTILFRASGITVVPPLASRYTLQLDGIEASSIRRATCDKGTFTVIDFHTADEVHSIIVDEDESLPTIVQWLEDHDLPVSVAGQ